MSTTNLDEITNKQILIDLKTKLDEFKSTAEKKGEEIAKQLTKTNATWVQRKPGIVSMQNKYMIGGGDVSATSDVLDYYNNNLSETSEEQMDDSFRYNIKKMFKQIKKIFS